MDIHYDELVPYVHLIKVTVNPNPFKNYVACTSKLYEFFDKKCRENCPFSDGSRCNLNQWGKSNSARYYVRTLRQRHPELFI